MEVRPEDEKRQDEQGSVPDAVGARVDEEPERGREERKGGRLSAKRPAPRAGQDREEADDEGRADDAPPARAVANARLEREKHERLMSRRINGAACPRAPWAA